MMSEILQGLTSVVTPEILAYMFIGTTIGIVFGSIPGLTSNMAVALCLPMTFRMGTVTGIAFLIALYIGGISGGLISAILINITGTPASVATTFYGGPMANKGQAGKALGVGITASFLGTILSIAALICISPVLARFALKFGPYELFAICVFSLTMLASLVSGSALKGITCAVLGIVCSLVGVAPTGGTTIRFGFGFRQLASGFDILPVLIGLFAVSEIFAAAIWPERAADKDHIQSYQIKGFGFSPAEAAGQLWNLIRSSLIGIGIGILPGIGGGTSNIIAYSVARQSSKEPEKFGTGIIDGVVASEASNNASIGGAMIPLLVLGIPGDTVTAMLLGGLVIKGINPGPLLFTNQAPLVYSIFFAMILSSIFMFAVMYLGMRFFVKVLTIPRYVLLPVVLALCFVGTYGANNRIFDCWVALAFGLVGFAMKRFEFPLPPFILGFVLGETVELNLIRSLQYSQNDLIGAFSQSPIAMVFLLIALTVVVFSVTKGLRGKKRPAA